MLDSIYVGLSGLSTFSAGLRNISADVANLNSTGYKGNSLQFSDLYYKMSTTVNGEATEQLYSQGTGVGILSERLNASAGELRASSSDTDVAIDGQGMFILRDGDKTTYTRAGNFQFDSSGYLIDTASKARVAGLDEAGNLQDIHIQNRYAPAIVTTEIKLTGQLSSGDTTGQTLTNIPLYDPTGGSASGTIKMVPGDVTTRSWKVTVSIPAGTLVSDQEIRFSAGDGTPVTGFNTVTFTYTPTGGAAQTIKLNFGDPGSSNSVVYFTSAATPDGSKVKQLSQDGRPVGVLQKTTFDTTGTLNLAYTNGQKSTGGRLALAWFDDLDALARLDGARFANMSGQAVTIRQAGDFGFGNIAGGKLEASNVDLAKEFSELIIIQRGYQTSSQIVQAANEMAQQLLEVVKQK